MKKGILIICLFTATQTNAQLIGSVLNKTLHKHSKKSKFSFEEINNGMVIKKVDTLNFLAFDDAALFSVGNKYPDEPNLNSLISRISFLDTEAGDLIKSDGWETDLKSVYEIISALKKDCPKLNLSGYDKLTNYYTQKNANKKRRTDSLKIVAINQYKEQKRIQDSAYKSDSAAFSKYRKDEDSLAKIDEQNQLKRQKEMKDEYKRECIKRFGVKIGNEVANGEMHLGYTMDMAEFAWGTCWNKKVTIAKGAKFQDWIYEDHYAILTFKNGILIAISDL